jgi:hypothetical protein
VFFVKAASDCVFDGLNSTDAWTPDLETGFKEALLASLPLVDSVDDINVTKVSLFSDSDRRHRRHLTASQLIVAYTLLITDGASSLTELVAAIEKEMIVAFNTSTFSTNLDEYGGDEWTGIDFNAQATVTIVEDGIEVTYIATIVTSKSPTSQPTLAPHEASPTSPSGPDAAFISIVAASFIVVVCIGVRIGRQVYGGSRKDKNETNRDSAVTGEISQLYKVEMLTRTSDNFSNMSRISNMSNLSNVSNFSNVSSFSNTSNSSASSHIDFGGDHLSGAYHIPRNKLTLEAKPFARGGGGQIFKGRYGASLVAAKQVFSNLDSGRMEEFERETGMLVELKHPNILSFFGTTMDEDGSLYQILEFCDGGDLQV